jgi:hypothetical protein
MSRPSSELPESRLLGNFKPVVAETPFSCATAERLLYPDLDSFRIGDEAPKTPMTAVLRGNKRLAEFGYLDGNYQSAQMYQWPSMCTYEGFLGLAVR